MAKNWFEGKLDPNNAPARPSLQRVQQQPQQQQHISPDGLWRWNGREWVSTQVIPPPPPPSAHTHDKGGRCPQCGSGNYLVGQQTQITGNQDVFTGAASSRCFDCGYQSGRNMEQSSSYDTTPTDRGHVAPHVRSQAESGGYHPDQIIGRIS